MESCHEDWRVIKNTGLAASKIRFYEQIGLLKSVKRSANGYRSYPAEAVVLLNLISSGQQAGFSLDELRALLPSDLTQWDHDNLLSTLKNKVADIEKLQERLNNNKNNLIAVIEEIEAKPADIDCSDNTRRVLSQFNIIKEHYN